MKKKSRISKFWKRTKKGFFEFIDDLKNKIVAVIFFIFAGFFFWVFMQLLYYFYGFSLIEFVKELPFVYPLLSHVFNEISSGSDLGIFYLFSVVSIFVLPVPLEALFFTTLKGGLTFFEIFLLVVPGIILGQIINYTLGRFLSFIFISFIKKKTRRNMTGKLKKYGIYAIAFVHIIPFPFQIFNFVTGILRYPFLRWLPFAVMGTVIKHIIMYYLFMGVL